MVCSLCACVSADGVFIVCLCLCRWCVHCVLVSLQMVCSLCDCVSADGVFIVWLCLCRWCVHCVLVSLQMVCSLCDCVSADGVFIVWLCLCRWCVHCVIVSLQMVCSLCDCVLAAFRHCNQCVIGEAPRWADYEQNTAQNMYWKNGMNQSVKSDWSRYWGMKPVLRYEAGIEVLRPVDT